MELIILYMHRLCLGLPNMNSWKCMRLDLLCDIDLYDIFSSGIDNPSLHTV